MLNNYFRIAIRNLLKHRTFSIINIFGLALSMSVCLVLIMLIADQASSDRYISNSSKIYRINTVDLDEDFMFDTYATAPLPLVEKLQEEYDGYTHITRIRRGFGNDWIGIDQNVNIPVGGFFVDPQFLDLFEYDLSSGDSKTALVKPHSVVLKEETSHKLFGNKDPIGEIITVGDLGEFMITGVIADNNQKSHIKFEALASFSTLPQLEENDSLLSLSIHNWNNHFNGWIYLLLDENKTKSSVENDLEAINKEIYSDNDERNLQFQLQSLTQITPGPLLGNEIGPTLPMLFVYFMAGLVLIVMISASFNYMNLTMARALTRAREVGVRKVSGATRSQLISQFLMEAVILSIIALIFSYIILVALKPAFQNLNFTRLLHWQLKENTWVYLLSFVFAILIGLLSGFAPALLLSSMRPIKVLKDLSGIKLISRTGIRKFLIGVQFSISLIFIISVIIVSRQLDLFFNAKFGFNTENIVDVRLNDTDYSRFKTSLEGLSQVQHVSGSTHIPASGQTRSVSIMMDPTDKEGIQTSYFSVDQDYIQTMGLQLLAGKNFTDLTNSSNEIIVNETAVKKFGFESNYTALGELITDDDSVLYRIVGVVRDYHHQAMTNEIIPMFLQYRPEEFRLVHVKIHDSASPEEAIAAINEAFIAINPGLKTTYRMMNEELKEFYDLLFGDLKKMVGVAGLLALVIACLGLLGMATYTIETRMKEVSIRKILGANDWQLIFQLSRGFLIILAVSILFSTPIAYLINNLWLELIAYRIDITIGIMSLSIGILVIFGLLTIVSQTYRASSVAPIENLRNE